MGILRVQVVLFLTVSLLLALFSWLNWYLLFLGAPFVRMFIVYGVAMGVNSVLFFYMAHIAGDRRYEWEY